MYWNEYKTKYENKNTTNEYKHFVESYFVNENVNINRNKALRFYLPEVIMKNYNVIISGKIFYEKPIDCDIKRYEEISKLTTLRGEDYTTGCALDYEYRTSKIIID